MTADAVDRTSSPLANITTRTLGAALAIAGAALIAAAALLPYNSVWPPPDARLTSTIVALAAVSVCWLVAALVALAADRRNPMWKLLFAYVVAQWIWVLGWIPTSLTWTLGDAFGQGLPAAIFVHALAAFPAGRLRTRHERWFVAGVYAFTLITNLVGAATYETHFTCEPVCITNLLFVWPAPAVNQAVHLVSAVGVPVIGLALVYLVIRHWRLGGPIARRALLPAVVILPFALVIKVSGFVGDNLEIQALSDFSRLPIAIATDAIVPLGLIAGIGRARLGRGRVADLLVELGRGVPLGGLRDVLARALDDPSLRLAYPASSGPGFVDPDGRAFDLPAGGTSRSITRIEHDGSVLALIDHDAAIDAESPGLLDAVGSAARLTLENERLAAEVRAQLEEVRASRARIAEAADDERRRVERDLHDGAQQRLVALTMRLEQARASTVGSTELIDDTTAELRAAIAEVRQLARGMHPPILTEAGLGAAVDSLAEIAPLPVTARVDPRRLPGPIEATAYFVVSEALANVAKHAGAKSASVTATIEGERLVLIVADDGHGGADASHGSGLRGLTDRVAAVGGTLTVTSPSGAGTSIRAEFPLS